jgi:coenzyme F420-reducing hydrogenase alpha subunit
VTIEGELTVRLAWDGRQVRRVAIRSSRPFAIARVLSGRTPEEAGAMVPRLFSICSGAQGAAAASALDTASAHSHDPRREAGRELATLLEAAQEHFWRLLIDWPKAMDHAAVTAPVAAARREIAPVLARLMASLARGGERPFEPQTMARLARALDELADHVYGMPSAAWLALSDPAALAAWADRGARLPAILLGELYAEAPDLGSTDVALMPTVTREALFATIVTAMDRDATFARAPVWDGVPVETGALARQQAHPLVAALRARDGNVVSTRMVARLTELAALLLRLRSDPMSPGEPPAVRGFALGEGEGLAAVETARGLLLHRVRLAKGSVAAYAIVAPTEWNFHPAGALARGLARLTARSEHALMRHVRIAVQALDPCVACHVEVEHA